MHIEIISWNQALPTIKKKAKRESTLPDFTQSQLFFPTKA
jgi:hypothetical protein